VYGSRVEYKGTLEGLGAGTGSAFALLPAQNATGNWIKVVQRVPVRIKLDPKDLVDYPLRVGLSMEAKVDVSHTEGRMLADGARASVATQTLIFEPNNSAADAEVRKIIGAHSGRVVSGTQNGRPSLASAGMK
jgi:membrane fusion protein, multidrug efflux system